MYKNYIKRCLDFLFSLILIPLFLVLFLLIFLAIKIEDRGPIFYKAKRVGKARRIYYMYKFRSMKVKAPDIRNADGSTYNSENDPRVTKIGKILRETSIDEVPQILNVLKGDMSFVGPRPGLPDLINSYQKDELDKLSVRPGITGFTQAYYRNGLSNREKRLKDSRYANTLSFKLDCKILIKTFLTVIRKEGLYTNSND